MKMIRLSKASKMPCRSWSLQALETCPGARKSNGELVDKNFMLDCNVSTREAFNIKEMMIMSYHVTGSYTYIIDLMEKI